jgi:hypothetical protein
MGYHYTMVQLNPVVPTENDKGNEVAIYLQEIVESYVKQGWEFYRVDTIGVKIKPGCLAGLFGAKEGYKECFVATFRAQSA